MYNYSQEKEHFIYIGFGNVIPNQQSEYRLYKLSCLDRSWEITIIAFTTGHDPVKYVLLVTNKMKEEDRQMDQQKFFTVSGGQSKSMFY